MDGEQFSTFFFFATALAAGVALVLPVLPVVTIGRRFLVLMSFVAIVFVALGLAAAGLATGYFHVGLAGLLILYNIVLPPQRGVDRSARREAAEGGPRPGWAAFSSGVLLAAAACGGAGVVLDAVRYPVSLGFSGPQAPWLSATFLSSSLVLGAALTAMVLGHWYLVVRNLSFTPLARVTLFFAAALAARILVAGGSAWAQRERWGDELATAGSVGFLLGPGVFLLARGVFGFLAPAALAWMTWNCVRIRSNQSATGILYVTLAFVVIGELISKYFLVSQGLVI